MPINVSASSRLPINFTLIVCFVEIFQTKRFSETFDIKNFAMRKFLRWMVEEDSSAFSKVIVALLQSKAGAHKRKKFHSIFAYTDSGILQKAGTQQVRQILRASTAVEVYTAKERRILECFFVVFRLKKLCTAYLNGSSFLQSCFQLKDWG